MCAVIGAILRNPSKQDFELLRNVFIESKIRGMHATGLSYLKGDKIITYKEPNSDNYFTITFIVNGNPFGNNESTTDNFLIRPNDGTTEEFFKNLDDLEILL